jgi:predicted nucleic acid binding AN1-type Zn finger protein
MECRGREPLEICAYCGLACHGCIIYLAARESDTRRRLEMRTEVARISNEIYGTDIKPEDVTDCDGCTVAGGRLFSGCSNCSVRKCAARREMENCAHCPEYPCADLRQIFQAHPVAQARLESIRAAR